MGRKNRNKNKKKKESDGSTGNVNGSSSSNNNKNNDITIPTMGATAATTTTTTIVLTTEEIDRIDNTLMLMGYPKSNDFLVGYRHYTANQNDLAIASFKRGAENDSCVPCMFCYVSIQLQSGNFHLAIPYVLEGAIRGHVMCMSRLVDCYQKTKPAFSPALAALWLKMMNEFGDYNDKEKRKETKKQHGTMCISCEKEESKDITLVQCGICKYYSYCGKNCQTRHWREGKHMNECRQVILLRKYCKSSYIKEIREAIIDGQDPKEIHTLQRLRMKLGLNRPQGEYEGLLESLANDDDINNNNNNNNNTIKRGTKVKVKGLVKASVHNGKFGIVINVSIPGEASSRSRVGVKLLDDSGTVLSIKIENLELSSASATMMTTTTNTNRLDPHEYLVGRKDGTVHIGSTPNII